MNISRTYYYSLDGIAKVRVGEANYYYRKNIQGDVTHIYDASGVLVAQYIYDAWGNHKIFAIDKNVSVDITENQEYNEHIGRVNPFRYRGYYFDSETGLYYLQSRYYDPATARFISADNISYLDPETINGLNLFAYCGNNPVMLSDSTGCSPWSDFWNSTWGKVVGTVLVVAGVVLLSVLTAGIGTAVTAAMGGFWGAVVGGAVGGAISGAIFGAGISMVTQGIANGYGNIDYGAVGMSALIGAASGAVLGGAVGGFRYLRAASFLKANGITDVKGTMASFKGTPRLRTLKADTTVYRVHGGASPRLAHWVSPKNYGSATRQLLSLPAGNTMAETSSFILSQGTQVLQGNAAGLFGLSGGGIQWWVAFLM